MSDTDDTERYERRSNMAVGAGVLAIVAFPLLALGRALGLWDANVILIGLTFLITLAGMLTAIVLGVMGLLTRGSRPWDD
ncbi:MAG: hypothetical protein RLN70_13620, partial [Rhodospirillaceae bacterium]